MQKAFNISLTIFAISATILGFAFISSLGLVNPIFEPRYDETPYILLMRAIITFADKVGTLDFLVTIFSGISSVVTGWLKNKGF